MRHKTISIIGGYGATGAVVTKKLSEESDFIINIAGRDLQKAKKLASEIGKNTTATQVNIFNKKELIQLCQTSFIIVNCAGPSSVIQDKIAQIALKECCNYVDVGGYEFTYDKLKINNEHIFKKDLSCILSAGWIPGVPEIMARYSDCEAKKVLDSRESMTIFYGDRNIWSENGLTDTIQYIKKNATRDMLFFKKGKAQHNLGVGFAKYFTLPFNNNRVLGFMQMIPELKQFASELSHYKKVKSYLVLFGWFTFLSMMQIKFLTRKQSRSNSILRKAYEKEIKKGILGVSIVEIKGKKGDLSHTLQYGIINKGGYEMTGLSCAAAVLQVANGEARKGINYLPELINPEIFIKTLEKWDIKILKEIINHEPKAPR